jgi:hypothetical protein
MSSPVLESTPHPPKPKIQSLARNAEFWVSRLIVLASTVLGVYLAASAALRAGHGRPHRRIAARGRARLDAQDAAVD